MSDVYFYFKMRTLQTQKKMIKKLEKGKDEVYIDCFVRKRGIYFRVHTSTNKVINSAQLS